jgi:hypothetical protein
MRIWVAFATFIVHALETHIFPDARAARARSGKGLDGKTGLSAGLLTGNKVGLPCRPRRGKVSVTSEDRDTVTWMLLRERGNRINGFQPEMQIRKIIITRAK